MVLYTGDAPKPSTSSAGEEAGKNKFMTGGSSGGSVGAGSVYMGEQYQGSMNSPHGGSGSVAPDVGSPYTLPLNDAYNFFNGFNGKQLRDFINTGQVAGQLKDDAGIIEAKALWKKLVDASAGLTAAGQKVTPNDVLLSYLGKGPLAAAGGTTAGGGASLWQTQYRGGRKFLVNTQTGEVKYQGPQFETTYAKTIDLTDPTTAKAIATSVFQQLMHRDPGKGEMGQFASALTNAEQNSPVVTNTTTEYDVNTGEAIGQTSKSTGGFGADAKQYLAQQQAKSNKEYGAIQASTTYANALENAIFNNPYGSM